MSSDVPFPAVDTSPPPLYDDIDGEEPGDRSPSGLEAWDREVDPQLFTSSNLFSADPSAEQEGTPGGLFFPDLPCLGGGDEVPDLFGTTSVAGNGTSSTGASASSKDVSWVSFQAYLFITLS